MTLLGSTYSKVHKTVKRHAELAQAGHASCIVVPGMGSRTLQTGAHQCAATGI